MTYSEYQKPNKYVELIRQCREHLSKIEKINCGEKEHYFYYFYCKEGLYKDEDGDYFKIDDFSELTLQQCIDYVNECRKNNKATPIQITKIKRWKYGKFEWITI
jgi:hypothetical protein